MKATAIEVEPMSYEEWEKKQRAENLARFNSMRNGTFVGELPSQYGNKLGGYTSGDMKKPTLEPEGDSE